MSHAFKALKTQAQNWHIATSAAFHWPQQVSRTAQIQGMERFQHFVERTTKSCCKGHGYNQGWEIWPIGVTNILQFFFLFLLDKGVHHVKNSKDQSQGHVIEY